MPIRCCLFATVGPNIKLELRDDGLDISVRIGLSPYPCWMYVTRTRQKHVGTGTYWIQDINGRRFDHQHGGRHDGLGTLLMNTALQYILQVADNDYTRIGGMLARSHDEQPTQMSERRAFFARFGVVCTLQHDTFDVALSDVTILWGQRGKNDVDLCPPLRDFRPCQ